MLGGASVSVLLIATMTGCASRPRLEPFLPNLNIQLECVTSIRLVDCDLFSTPTGTAAPLPSLTVRAGEQVMAVVK